jgi:uncharacterized protein YcfJ
MRSNTMKLTSRLGALLLGAMLIGNAAADRGHQYGRDHRPGSGYAKVLRVTPIYRSVDVPVSEQHCTDSETRLAAGAPDRAALIGAVVGGMVGAVAGNQIGQGNGRTVATVAGTALGAAIGYRVGPGAAGLIADTQVSRRRCQLVERLESREELLGYRVKYRYKGHIFHTRTNHHPGRRIRVGRRAHQTHF